MEKGILKKVVLTSLAVLSGVLMVGGMTVGVIFYNKSNKEQEKKESILKEYALTEEHLAKFHEAKTFIDEILNEGIISKKEYSEKIDYLLSNDFIEDCILEDEECAKAKTLSQLNTQIDKYDEISSIGFVGLPAGLILGFSTSLPLVLKEENDEEELSYD